MLKKNSRIIYVGAFRFPNGDAASQRVLNNAKIFKHLGYIVEFISWGGNSREIDKSCDGFYYYEGFRYLNTFEIDNSSLNPLKRLINFFFRGKTSLRILLNSIDKTNIIIVYNPSLFFTKKIVSICKRHGVKFISDITEWYASNELPGGRYALPFWISEINMRLIQKKIKTKIVISNFLNTYYKNSHNIIIPPLVDPAEQKWTSNKRVLPEFDGTRFIYAGSPGNKDLLETIIESVIHCLNKKLKIQFIILGVSYKDIKNYKCYNHLANWRENILLLGLISHEVVPSYYHGSDFSIIIRKNSRKNNAGFPTKLVESLVSGCPVIANLTSDISKYIIDGKNGYVLSEFSACILIEVIKKVSELSTTEKKKLKTQAYIDGKKYFSYREYINEMNVFLNNK